MSGFQCFVEINLQKHQQIIRGVRLHNLKIPRCRSHISGFKVQRDWLVTVVRIQIPFLFIPQVDGIVIIRQSFYCFRNAAGIQFLYWHNTVPDEMTDNGMKKRDIRHNPLEIAEVLPVCRPILVCEDGCFPENRPVPLQQVKQRIFAQECLQFQISIIRLKPESIISDVFILLCKCPALSQKIIHFLDPTAGGVQNLHRQFS